MPDTSTRPAASARPAAEPGAAASGHLELVGLRKTFQTKKSTFQALGGIELDIAPGEFITLLGPSGCGKTTTLRIIAGFETPSQGDVVLDGASVIAVTPDKRPMAMVFQSYALFPHMSVKDNVAYGLKLKKLPAAELADQVGQALESMGLTQLGDRAPAQLSGGQQQRVALARAMVMRPKVLLFDEPLSNLDAKLRVQMRSEIRRLQQSLGITAVYVTHDQDEAMSLSDRIVVMNQGLIEQAARPFEIYRRPASVFVADFIGRANFLPVAEARPAGAGQSRATVLGQDYLTAAADNATTGQSVLLVRPESIRLAASAEPSISGRVGRVVSAVFYGQSVEYRVQTTTGAITAVVPDPDPA
ncbi:MAG: ABC transporter ATP-binding protein, partial [Propionibacteriaceae bacterium]|nr:ABC transporter ATP-binding protein [Propionibacteriaceae bacterium]